MRLLLLIRSLFCRHEWTQRYWGATEHAVLCIRCQAIRYRKGPGGPLPAGVSTNEDSQRIEGGK